MRMIDVLGRIDTLTKSQSKEALSQTHGGDPRKQNHLLHASVSLFSHFLSPFGTCSFAKLNAPFYTLSPHSALSALSCTAVTRLAYPLGPLPPPCDRHVGRIIYLFI